MDVTTKKKGCYFGTEVGGKWWKPCFDKGFFVKGNGSFWMDGQGLHFHKLLTREPLTISWDEMRGARVGKWHAGKWGCGYPVLKVDFERGGRKISAGFLLDKDPRVMQKLSDDLRKKVSLSGS